MSTVNVRTSFIQEIAKSKEGESPCTLVLAMTEDLVIIDPFCTSFCFLSYLNSVTIFCQGSADNKQSPIQEIFPHIIDRLRGAWPGPKPIFKMGLHTQHHKLLIARCQYPGPLIG